MSERTRFHPLALIVYLFNGIKGWFVFFLLGLLNGWFQHRLGQTALLVVVLWIVLQSVLKYFSESYQISSEKIIIYQGIWNKKETDIPYERIQTIKKRQWFFFKPFNTMQLLIETAGGAGAEAEASLAAVHTGLVDTIERYRQGERPETGETEMDSGADYRVTNGQIFLFGITDLSILASLIAIPIFVDEFIPDNWLREAASVAEQLWRAGWLLMIGVMVLLLMAVALISLAKTFIRYYDFRVNRSNQTLTIESGLFERHTQKIPLDKIQGLKIQQQLLRRLFGISSVELLLAGGHENEGESIAAKKLYVLPIISDQNLYQTLDVLLPEWDFKKPDIQYVSRKRLWYFWRWKLSVVPLIIWLGFVSRWLAVVGWIVLLVFLLDGWLDSRFQGYTIQSANRLCVQTNEFFSKVQTFVERSKVQSFSQHTTKRLLKKDTGHIKMFLKAGLAVELIQLRFIDVSDIQRLKNFYTKKA